MMNFTFDLISDLHVDTWPETDWHMMPTSPMAIVAGDISSDRTIVVDTLKKLGKAYQAVFYIDGNEEHEKYLHNLGHSYADLVSRITPINNVVYLQDNVVVINGLAILGTNGWWGFDFDLSIDPTASCQAYQEKYNLSSKAVKTIAKMSNQDASYMINSIQRLQYNDEISKIIVVTHTVPDAGLISHDIEINGRLKFNTMGNRVMKLALEADVENKIHTWCFGHYHGSIDQYRNGVRFVNNCRGRNGTAWSQHVYHPRRIMIEV